MPRPSPHSQQNWKICCSMSADSSFRCPVCRASQTLRETCRRCQADLGLVMRANLRLAYVKRQQAEAIAQRQGERGQMLAGERRWLDPSG